MLDFLGDCGGFLDALLIICMILVQFFSGINMNVQKIQIFQFLLDESGGFEKLNSKSF